MTIRRFSAALLFTALMALVTAAGDSPLSSAGVSSAQVGVSVKVDVNPATPEIESTLSVNEGDSLDVSVVAEGVPDSPGLGALAFDLIYDAEVLAAEDVEASEAVGVMMCIVEAVVEPGLARLVCAFFPLRPGGPTGTVVLGTVSFSARGAGETELELRDTALYDADETCLFESALGCERAPDTPEGARVEVASAGGGGGGDSGPNWTVIGSSAGAAAIVLVVLLYAGLRLARARARREP